MKGEGLKHQSVKSLNCGNAWVAKERSEMSFFFPESFRHGKDDFSSVTPDVFESANHSRGKRPSGLAVCLGPKSGEGGLQNLIVMDVLAFDQSGTGASKICSLSLSRHAAVAVAACGALPGQVISYRLWNSTSSRRRTAQTPWLQEPTQAQPSLRLYPVETGASGLS